MDTGKNNEIHTFKRRHESSLLNAGDLESIFWEFSVIAAFTSAPYTPTDFSTVYTHTASSVHLHTLYRSFGIHRSEGCVFFVPRSPKPVKSCAIALTHRCTYVPEQHTQKRSIASLFILRRPVALSYSQPSFIPFDSRLVLIAAKANLRDREQKIFRL